MRYPSDKQQLEIVIKKLGANDASLTKLDFTHSSWNMPFIDYEEALALINALKTNSTLTTLHLRRAAIDRPTMTALVDVLKTNRTLTTLQLTDLSIDSDKAIALAEALKTNRTLTTFDLSRNNIDYRGAMALAKALETNTTLTSINLLHNKFGHQGEGALKEALLTNISVTEFLVTISDEYESFEPCEPYKYRPLIISDLCDRNKKIRSGFKSFLSKPQCQNIKFEEIYGALLSNKKLDGEKTDAVNQFARSINHSLNVSAEKLLSLIVETNLGKALKLSALAPKVDEHLAHIRNVTDIVIGYVTPETDPGAIIAGAQSYIAGIHAEIARKRPSADAKQRQEKSNETGKLREDRGCVIS